MPRHLSIDEAAALINDAVAEWRPFSFVRVGDGEAMLCTPGSGSERYPTLGAYDATTDRRIRRAVAEADLVGIQQRRDGDFGLVGQLLDSGAWQPHLTCDADLWYRLEPETIARTLHPSSMRFVPWCLNGRRGALREFPDTLTNLLGIWRVIKCAPVLAHQDRGAMQRIREACDGDGWDGGNRGHLCACGPLGTILPPLIADELEVPALDIGGLADVWVGEETRTIIRDLGLAEKWRAFCGATEPA